MSAEFYQKLLDRCWRRSGTLMYRPNQRDSCCPHYTIRLDSGQFHPARDQRHAVNRFNKYILGDDYLKAAARLHPRSKWEAKKRETEFDLVERVHESEASRAKRPPSPAHRFEVALEPDDFTEEKFRIFQSYQGHVHKEEAGQITRPSFKRFLCSSPLRRETVQTPAGSQKKLGSYHQMYRIDGELVAVGVLDLLPQCVSAVYFMYHDSVHKHSFGKLGALREIALAIEGGYKWWYPGFYIHSCPKMRYKIEYSPQYVLDPEALTWDLLDKDALTLFDKKDYVSLSGEKKKASNADGENHDTDDVEGEATTHDNTSLFHTNMPGIPSLQDMRSVDLDHISLCLDSKDDTFLTSDLVVWEDQSVDTSGALKASIAEFAAALGPDLLGEICLDFRRDQ
ncbi:hypothetical protein MKZ38_010269 [Zalerion maritima]|uniref:arginyltransferase n=1 Tax=Zalerion maritima TaxID=339359 RepID=A0AAD5RG60_9PEZI|nr:hypothetical protein MKZ38_010269 [Zalerion maritima]